MSADASPAGATGRVLWHTTMSLDGFVAGPDDAMEWVFDYDDPNPAVDEVIATTGAILAGRRSYDVGRRDTGKPSGEAFGGAWHGPEFVLTHHPPDDDPARTFLQGDVRAAVAHARAAADGGTVLILGADVARQCLQAGVMDEILVHVAPILLGDGVRLRDAPGAAPVRLEPMSVEPAGRVANLRYRVARGR